MAAHAVIRQGLINLFWFRELLTNNSIQPRAPNGIEGRTMSFPGMGPLIVSFVKSAALVRRMFYHAGQYQQHPQDAITYKMLRITMNF